MDARIKLGIAVGIIAFVMISSVSFTRLQVSADKEHPSSTIRIGYFATLNHAQAVIGLGNGDFQKKLGDIDVKSRVFTAGPYAIEALLTNQIDVAYVGSNPAVNGYITSNGTALRIISGASSGGAVLVVRNDSGIKSPEDFKGKLIASPDLGNTQDVALRTYLKKQGFDVRVGGGGDVDILPAKPSDILALMVKKEIDGAWVPEPWGARLTREANAHIFLDERDLWPGGKFSTAQIVVRTGYLESNPENVRKLLEANVEETMWINSHKDEAIKEFNVQIEHLLGKGFPEEDIRTALSRMEITYDPVQESLIKSANNAFELGLLGTDDRKPDLSGIYDLKLLNKVLTEKGLDVIPS